MRQTGARILAAVVLAGGLWAGVEMLRVRRSPVRDLPLPPSGAVAVVELFTSEGCSSCPPADAVLDRLVHQQPVAGVRVLGLSEHVDYWSRLGWSDPFSSPLFSSRQGDYDARVFRTGRIYTPQVVVDGRTEEVGSDMGRIQAAIKRAVQDPKASVRVASVVLTPGELRLDVRVDIPANVPFDEAVDLVLAVTEDHLVSEVNRGENRGRLLQHASVVRSLGPVGVLRPPTRGLSMTASVRLDPAWKVEELGATAFLQERQSRRIIGAAGVDIDHEIRP